MLKQLRQDEKSRRSPGARRGLRWAGASLGIASAASAAIFSMGCEERAEEPTARTTEQQLGTTPASYEELGATPIILDGAARFLESDSSFGSDVTGATHRVVQHPTNSDILYVGTVGGGVWKTTNGSADRPDWEPLTEFEESLSIGDLAMDSADSSRLVAGTGFITSFGAASGAQGRLLFTDDDGASWTPLPSPTGSSIRRIHMTGDRLLVLASNGLWRTEDLGGQWDNITLDAASNLPAGNYVDLAEDPEVPGDFYLAIAGAGVYYSSDDGEVWDLISDSNTTNNSIHQALTANGADNAKLDVGFESRLYVAVGNLGRITTVGYTDNAGTSWTKMARPFFPLTAGAPTIAIETASNATPIQITTDGPHGLNTSTFAIGRNINLVQISGVEGNTNANGIFIAVPDATDDTKFTLLNLLSAVGVSGNAAPTADTGTVTILGSLSPVGQSGTHMALEAHPTDKDGVYIGGDGSIGQFGWATVGILRGDAGAATGSSFPSNQWQNIVGTTSADFSGGGTSNNTFPHADTRDFLFDSNNDLIHVGDGGIARHSNPSGAGDWASLNGDLAVLEYHDVAYDPVSQTATAGSQDNGTSSKNPGTTEWRAVWGGDGGDVQIRPFGSGSRRYFSSQNLGGFSYEDYDSSGNRSGSPVAIATNVDKVCANDDTVSCSTDADCGNDGDGNPISCRNRTLCEIDGCQFVTEFEINGTRMVIGGAKNVYESSNQGTDVVAVAGNITGTTAMAYGHVDDPQALWVLTNDASASVYNRATASDPLVSVSSSVGAIQSGDIVMSTNSGESNIAFMVNGYSSVFKITENGAADTVENITGDLGQQERPPTEIYAIEYVANASAGDRLFIGSNTGVFMASVDNPEVWSRTGTDLPYASAYDLQYSASTDTLIVGTMGRGAFIVNDASTLNRAPVAECKRVVLDADEMCLGHGEAEDMDNGSYDPDGDDIAFSIDPESPYDLGFTWATLTVTDEHGAAAACGEWVQVIDVTPPVFDPIEDVSLTMCNHDQGVVIEFPTASDNCAAPPTITGQVIASTNPNLTVPQPIGGAPIVLGIGTHTIEWVASDGPNQTTATQTYTIGGGVYATNSFELRDRARVEAAGGQLAGILNSGPGQTIVGNDAKLGDIMSVGSVVLRDRAEVDGIIRTGGTVQVQNQVTHGLIQENQTLVFPPFYSVSDGFVGGASYHIEPDGFLSLGPDQYGSVHIKSRSELELVTGDYFIEALLFEPQGILTARALSGPVVVRVENQLQLRQQIQILNTTSEAENLILAYFGSDPILFETSFTGIIYAPNARVSLGSGNQLNYTGQLYARDLELRPDVVFVCQGDD